MKHLKELAQLGADRYGIAPILAELDAHPELWNQYTLRTRPEFKAHVDVSDIWVRYRDFRDFLELRVKRGRLIEHAVREFVTPEHESVWYPAADALPSLLTLVNELVHHYRVERLGGVLITRIPPGGEVKPHVDHGWHARYYEKIAVQIRSHPEQTFCFEDGQYSCPPGAVYTFCNQETHWVVNPSPAERITCIICVRRDQRTKPLWQE